MGDFAQVARPRSTEWAAPRSARTPGEPNDFALRRLFAFAVLRPSLSELPPLLEQVAASIGGFDFVAHGVRECQLPNLAREVRPLSRPIGVQSML
jgi:hypothetical protein